jgi:hypothetical protein
VNLQGSPSSSGSAKIPQPHPLIVPLVHHLLLFVGVGLLVNILFGFGIFSIAFGAFLAWALLASTFEFPYRLMVAVLRLPNAPTHLPPARPLQRIIICVALLTPALLIAAGVLFLHRVPFCIQNPLCLIWTLLRRLSP